MNQFENGLTLSDKSKIINDFLNPFGYAVEASDTELFQVAKVLGEKEKSSFFTALGDTYFADVEGAKFSARVPSKEEEHKQFTEISVVFQKRHVGLKIRFGLSQLFSFEITTPSGETYRFEVMNHAIAMRYLGGKSMPFGLRNYFCNLKSKKLNWALFGNSLQLKASLDLPEASFHGNITRYDGSVYQALGKHLSIPCLKGTKDDENMRENTFRELSFHELNHFMSLAITDVSLRSKIDQVLRRYSSVYNEILHYQTIPESASMASSFMSFASDSFTELDARYDANLKAYEKLEEEAKSLALSKKSTF